MRGRTSKTKRGKTVEGSIPFPLNENIGILGLPTRLENTLNKHGIQTLDALLNAEEVELLKFRNVGLGSVKFLRKIKDDVRIGKLNTIKKRDSESTRVPDGELISHLFGRCGGERDIDVIRKRYGLDLGEKLTLEEIGAQYGLTRERIRQIQSRALKRMRHPSNLARGRIIQKVDSAFAEKGNVMSNEEADVTISGIFVDIKYDGSSFLDFIGDLGWIQSYRLGDIYFYAPNMSGFRLVKLVEGLELILRQQQLPMHEDEIVGLSTKFFTGVSSKDRRVTVLRLLELDPRFQRKFNDYYGLYANHGSTKLYQRLITETLELEGIPMHFTEISYELNKRLKMGGKGVDVRRVHSILVSTPSFAHTGIRGTYGLTSWGIKKESTPEVVAESLRRAGFPLHFDQIYDYVKRYKDSPKINIRSILEFNKTFKKLPNSYYELNERYKR